jgi:hypothetical protein
MSGHHDSRVRWYAIAPLTAPKNTAPLAGCPNTRNAPATSIAVTGNMSRNGHCTARPGPTVVYGSNPARSALAPAAT